MKSIVLVENQKLIKKELPIPVPQKGEYLIKIRSAGVCNSDLFRGLAGGAYQ